MQLSPHAAGVRFAFAVSRLAPPLLLAACSRGPGDDGLYGTKPLDPIPAPVFAVVADDGAPRDRDDLLGHATVMWFYPAAATSG